MFYDAGILYYLKEAVNEFFKTGLSTGNQLLKSVEADSTVEEFWAACRSLGLINKFVTGPFWESDNHSILDMNEKYKHMVACFEDWADNSSSVVDGTAMLFQEQPLHVDQVSDALLKPDSNDLLVQEILETISSGFSALLQRMVADHLSGGVHDGELTVETRKETISVQKMNTISEHDFAQLDRLLREKPNASTMSIEAMIMFSNNKTTKQQNGFKQSQQKREKKYSRVLVKRVLNLRRCLKREE